MFIRVWEEDAALDRSFRVDTTGAGPVTVQLTATSGQAFLSAAEITGLQAYSNPLVN